MGEHIVRARIFETEAYLGFHDPASHGYRGRRHSGNLGLYSPPGHWYVYRSYGIHWCLNVVTGPPGSGGAVLLRGATVLEGEEVARERRGRSVEAARLADGPGKLCQALAIDRAVDGVRIRGSTLTLERGEAAAPEGVLVTPRIGITKAADWPLRFLLTQTNGAAEAAPLTPSRVVRAVRQ